MPSVRHKEHWFSQPITKDGTGLYSTNPIYMYTKLRCTVYIYTKVHNTNQIFTYTQLLRSLAEVQT